VQILATFDGAPPPPAPVARTANVTIRFGETVTDLNGTSLMLLASTGRKVAAVFSCNRTTGVATLNPTGSLSAHARYTVAVTSAIKDAAGNRLTATHWSFTTA